MKIEFGIRRFGRSDDGVGFVDSLHERALRAEPRAIAADASLDGYVRIVAADGSEMQIHDDPWALLLNLGFTAPARLLDGDAAMFEWHLGSQARTVSVTGGDAVTLTQRSLVEPPRALSAPAADYWPAAVGAGSRFRAWLASVRGAAHPQVEALREPEERALAAIRVRGWSLPAAPEPDDAPEAAEPVPAVFSGLVLFARQIGPSRAFYAEVLDAGFETVPVSPADGDVGPPQWVGTLASADPETLADRLSDAGGVELGADADRRVWMDPWGGLVAAAPRPECGLQVARSVLATPDPEHAARFYADWLGWTARPDGRAWTLTAGGSAALPVRTPEPGESARWLHFLAVDDLHAAVARAEASGGRVLARGPDGVWLRDPYEGEFGLAPRGQAGGGPAAPPRRGFDSRPPSHPTRRLPPPSGSTAQGSCTGSR